MQGIFFTIPIILITIVLFLYFVPLGLWIQAGVSIGWGKIGMIKLVIMRIRKIPPKLISDGIINLSVAQNSLSRLGIDKNGLDDMDRRILTALVEKFNGGPVGLESLGVAISEDSRTIEEVYEPYLIKEGFIQRTSRGRKALDKTFSYLDIENPDKDSQIKIL